MFWKHPEPVTNKTDNNINMIDETASGNSLFCDPDTGFCGLPSDIQALHPDSDGANKPVKVVYFSDPLCSACWGAEPMLNKLKLEYGDTMDIEYRMGGLLPNWKAMGNATPARVAAHVDEMQRHFEMPMTGKTWALDPPHSSFPPSIAFKAAQMQDEIKAVSFLRRLREMFFVEAINIAKWEHIVAVAAETGLNTTQLQQDYEGSAGELFEQDMELARQLGIKGFPTLVFSNGAGDQETVQGAKYYDVFEQAILRVCPDASKQAVAADWHPIFGELGTLTTKEFAVLSNRSIAEANAKLEALAQARKIDKHQTQAGELWRALA